MSVMKHRGWERGVEWAADHVILNTRTPPGRLTQLGDHVIDYSVEDQADPPNKAAGVTRRVVVKDTTPPAIALCPLAEGAAGAPGAGAGAGVGAGGGGAPGAGAGAGDAAAAGGGAGGGGGGAGGVLQDKGCDAPAGDVCPKQADVVQHNRTAMQCVS